MPHSLRSRIKKLAYQKVISEKDRDRIISALDFSEGVVHCKECKYWSMFNEEFNSCLLSGYFIGENGYCLYGKEKE